MDNEWATLTIKEVPFWRDDMTPEEYDIERTYFYGILIHIKKCPISY